MNACTEIPKGVLGVELTVCCRQVPLYYKLSWPQEKLE